MGKDPKDKIDRAYREARVSAFIGDIGDIRVVLAFLALGVVVAVALFWVSSFSSPPRLVAHTTGHAVGQFADQGETGPPKWYVSVRLKNGVTASVVMPKDLPYRTDADLKVDVYQHGFGPIGWNSYRFAGYAEPVK